MESGRVTALSQSRFPVPALIVAGVSGLVVLVIEFAAVRMLAPAFGQSNYVWANVIGWILVALAGGYWFGGRLADRRESPTPLFIAHGLAALYTIGAALVGPSLCNALIPEGIEGGGALPLAFVGSSIAAIALFVVPALLLGMTSPFLIRMWAGPDDHGRTTGRIYAVGTLGSLVACYYAPTLWLQVWGTRLTLFLCAAVLIVMAAAGIALLRGHRKQESASSGETESAAARRVPMGLLGIALLAGAAITIIEFSAIRFMSPWFGQSNHIWANVIGVIMLGIAQGSALGGRFADRSKTANLMFGAFGLAAMWLALVAVFGPRMFDLLAPSDLLSMQILPVARYGSLFSAALCFGSPVLLLAMATPFLVRIGAKQAPVGRTAGAMLAWGTVGGLIGCFLTPVILVPVFGSRGTLVLVGLAIAVVSLQQLIRARARRFAPALAGALSCAGVLVWQMTGSPTLRWHDGQLAEVESRYQTIRVVQRSLELMAPEAGITPAQGGKYGTTPMRFLRHDEDAETYQSLYVLRRPNPLALTGIRYFEHMAVGATFIPRRESNELRVLIIGYAGGTVYRTLREIVPDDVKLTVLGVEIDPGVITVAREYLSHAELEGEGLELITGEDARTVVNALPASRTFDLVLVDAYARTNYLPFQLASKEFFEKVRSHLAPEGWLGVNVLGNGMKGVVAKSVATTMTDAVGPTFVTPNRFYLGNVILWSSPGGTRAPRVRLVAPIHKGLLAAVYDLERMTVLHDPKKDGGVVLTDDLSPSDRMADEELGL